jgi:FkbM family methyltransferase
VTVRQLARVCTPRWARNWSRRPTKSAQSIWCRLRFAFGSTTAVELREGFLLRCHPLAREFFDVFRTDAEQSAELDSFIRHCSTGMRLLDLGAHYGAFALASLHYGGSESKALCVEASWAAARILRKNLALNGVTSRCQVLNIAVAACDGYLAMLTTGPFSGDYVVASREDRNDTTLIASRTIASVLSQARFTPTHLKIDIEGCEVDVIHNSRQLLEKLRPVIFLELHGKMIAASGQHPNQVIADLRECGYRHFEIGGSKVEESLLKARGYDCRMICLP